MGPIVPSVTQPSLTAERRRRTWSTSSWWSTTGRSTTPRPWPAGRGRRGARARRAGGQGPGHGGGPRPRPTATSSSSSTPTSRTSARTSSPACSARCSTDRPDVALVKGFYERPLHGEPDGRRPGHRAGGPPRHRPALPRPGRVRQPLAGETAAHRWVLEKVGLRRRLRGRARPAHRRGRASFGVEPSAQVDLGVRVHRNRPLAELRPQATDVLRAALERTDPSTLPRRSITAP